MRILIRSAIFATLFLAPATAMAWVWPFAVPSLPEANARAIAMQNGIDSIADIDGTLDSDWLIRGTDVSGNEIELVIDGKTGALERAEMDAE